VTTPGTRIPGIRYKTITRTRMVQHTVDGRTHTIPEEYQVEVPVPPRDWDRALNAAVAIGTVALVTVSVAWSTASIGDLLSNAVTPVIAYAAAGIFDSTWIVAMALEWLCRYDQARARRPRITGNIALAIAMGAVGTHGWISGNPAIGIVGGSISLMAKSVWYVVMRDKHRQLDPRTRAWLDHAESEVAAALALASRQRELARSRAQTVLMGQIQPPTASILPAPTTTPRAKPQRPQPPSTPAGPAGSKVDDVHALLGRPHGPLVYFLSNGTRVKIGTSQNLKRRIDTLCLRPDDLLFALHGDQRTERALHDRFAAQRVTNTEWFEIAGTLAEYIAEQTGRPVADVPDAGNAQQETPHDADDASADAPQVTATPRIGPGVTKTAAILAASAALHPDASPASIAQLLAQQGLAVDTAYIRTVLSRSKPKDTDDVGQGGGGYA
jgi:hypothetical protein